MSKGLLNSMVLKNLFEDVNGKDLLPVLIESGVITKEQVEGYYKANIKLEKSIEQPKTEYSIIERLIDEGVFTHKDVEQYLANYNKKKEKQKRLIQQQVEETSKAEDKQVKIYSQIEKGVLVKADERDVDKNGKYTVPAGVSRIKQYAFSECKEVTTVTLGPNVKTIEPHAFFRCRARYIDLGRVETIGDWAFSNCDYLAEIVLSSRLQRVGMAVFYNCINLKRFIVPTGGDIILKGSRFANRADAQWGIVDYVESNKEAAK